MKAFTWILNHLKSLLAVVVFGTTLAVIGGTMFGSYNDYKSYENKYNENDLEVRSANAAEAKRVEINDNFKSKLKHATDLELQNKSGAIVAEIELTAKSFVDLDFVIEVTELDEDNQVKDLFSVANFVVNGAVMEEEVTLDAGEHHLTMVGFALPAGVTTIGVSPKNGKEAYMPIVSSITFYSNATTETVAQPA